MASYYAVRTDRKSWSRDAIPESGFIARGFEIKPARSVGDAGLWKDGRLVSFLFESKTDAATFVNNGGIAA